jgi:hypothetical protein
MRDTLIVNDDVPLAVARRNTGCRRSGNPAEHPDRKHCAGDACSHPVNSDHGLSPTPSIAHHRVRAAIRTVFIKRPRR